MKNLLTILMLAFGLYGYVSAQDIDIDARKVPKEVMSNFKKMFPKAEVEEWDKFKDFYEVTFLDAGAQKEALYSLTGEWLVTEHLMKYYKLPQKVKDAFESSEYKDWKVKDAAEVQMKELAQAYGIDVHKGSEEYALYFDADGKLVKKTED